MPPWPLGRRRGSRFGYRPLFCVGFLAPLCGFKPVDPGQGAGDPLMHILFRPTFSYARLSHAQIHRLNALTHKYASFDLHLGTAGPGATASPTDHSYSGNHPRALLLRSCFYLPQEMALPYRSNSAARAPKPGGAFFSHRSRDWRRCKE
jgi:hypothetical protein